jgi:acetoin utilization deacetylase AcuC-like enzyme
MDELILPLLDRKEPQMLLVSYGFDPHWLDPLGQLLLTADGYAKIIRKLCRWADAHCEGRLALILEGGYDLNAGKSCSLAVLSAMLEREWFDPYPCPYKESTAWFQMLQKAHALWGI